jgi:hypothetical protein
MDEIQHVGVVRFQPLGSQKRKLLRKYSICLHRRRIKVTDASDDLFEHIASAERSLAGEESAFKDYLHIFVIMLKQDASLAMRNKILKRCIPSIILVFDEVDEDAVKEKLNNKAV